MNAKGGKAIYGASLGILMLEAQFPRIMGDMGNAKTWDFPVHYKVVRGASPELVVLKGAKGLTEPFIQAAQELEKDGVDGITTNCGFLSVFQECIANACKVPVACSSLMQYGMIKMTLPTDKLVGIITISKESITPAHLKSMNIPADTPIVGTHPESEFSRTILRGKTTLNTQESENDLIKAAKELIQNYPDVGAILLECTNMPPYSRSLRKMTGLPVFDIYSLVQWFQCSLNPPLFDQTLF